MSRFDFGPEVARLLADRAAARTARDWATADALRDEIRDRGWEPVDAEGGSSARPILSPTASDLPSLLLEEASVAASLLVVLDDHPDDLARFLRGLAAHPPAVTWELVIVANAPLAPAEPLLAASWSTGQSLPAATVLPSEVRLGWADAVNLGLRRSRGEVTVLLDTSLEPVGDLVRPLLAAFEDETVGIAGGWGVTSEDGRQFVEAPPGEVDAIEGYCLAIRREALRSVGGFDAHFRFYRHADLDLSFAIRDSGWRAVRTAPLPVTLHPHRGWEAFPPAERDRLSRRNFYRFLKRWRDRSDLLVPARTAQLRGKKR
jgi:GT2 family glycosyltransferase